MLVDAGGYTIDITLNKIIDKKGNLQQLSPPSGGSYGSININKKLVELFSEIISLEKTEQIKNNNYGEWVEILEIIEEKKIQFALADSSDSNKMIIKKNLLKCENKKENCKKLVKYGYIEYNTESIIIPREIINTIIREVVKQTISEIKKIVEKYNNIIDKIVLVGGFSDSFILKEEIKKNFEQHYQQLENHVMNVVKGAVLFGIEPNAIISRIIPYTIGVSDYEEPRAGKECRDLIYDDYGLKKCKYFDIFAKKGDSIANNQIFVKKYIPLRESQTGALINLYFSNDINPIYVEQGIPIASFIIEAKETNISITKRVIEVSMEFSSCITVSAKNIISGQSVRVLANYYYNRKEE